MTQPRVAVLMGGLSSEHDISVGTGEQVVAAIGDAALPVVIGRDGAWTFGDDRVESLGAAIDQLRARADVVFVALHGPFGEDGTVQGLLDSAGLPYTGSGVLGSALAMDKVRAKYVYRSADLPTPAFEAIDRRRWRTSRADVITAVTTIGYPCVLKPAASGSSFGVAFVSEPSQVESELDQLFEDVELVLAEERLTGAEFSCGVIDIGREDRIVALPVIEIIPDPDRYAYFDFEAKYTPGATQEITPARIDDALADRMKDLARRCHEVLGCRDFSRTDFLLDPAGAPSVLETNTIPGLTPASLLPKSAKAAGYAFEEFVAIIVDNAVRRGPATFY